MDEANPWEPSPWGDAGAGAGTDATSSTTNANQALASPGWGAGGGQDGGSLKGSLPTPTGSESARPAIWGNSAPEFGSSTTGLGASPTKTRGVAETPPSTAGIDPPAWGGSASNSPVQETAPRIGSISSPGAAPGSAALSTTNDSTPPQSATSKYSSAASYVEGDPWGTDAGPQSAAPSASAKSDVSGWAPQGDDHQVKTPISSASAGGAGPSSSVPESGSQNSGGWPSSAGVADLTDTRLTPVSAGWSGALGGSGDGVLASDDLEEESPWGPPPETKVEDPRDVKVAESMSADALQATIEKRLHPEKVEKEETTKKPLEITVPARNSTDVAAPGSGASTPKDPQSASAGQPTWLARLRATQKTGNTSPTAGRNSMEAPGKRSEETTDKPAYTQTSKQEANKSGILSSFLTSAKERVALPKVVSAADEDDEDDLPPPQTSTTASFSTNPDSANDLLSFDDEGKKKQEKPAKARADNAPQQPSVVSRWLGGWRKKNEDVPPHVAAGVSEEAYADRLGAGEALTQADLDWLDKNAPAMHSPQNEPPYSASSDLPSAIDISAARARTSASGHLQPPSLNRNQSDSSGSPGSPLDNWLSKGMPAPQSASSRPQYANQTANRPVTIGQPPHGGPRGASTVGYLRTPGTAPLPPPSGRSNSTFGDFQGDAFSDWSPALASGSKSAGLAAPSTAASSMGAFQGPVSAARSSFSNSSSGVRAGGAGRFGPMSASSTAGRYRDDVDPFESGKANTIDEDFGRDYRDDDDDGDFGVLQGGPPGYRDDPDFLSSPGPRATKGPSRAAQPNGHNYASGLPPRLPNTGARAPSSALNNMEDLLGGLSESTSKPTTSTTAPRPIEDDLLSDFVSSSKSSTAASISQPPRPSSSSSNSAGQRRSGPLLPPPPGSTRAGGLLPPLSSGPGAASRLAGPSAQQVRGTTTQPAAKPTGPSSGKGMTQDDLSFFETL